ncbi:MAG: zinc ABC transporter substrate-binding protein, partial [Pseudobutyrivibrio sp.]|nr:zinc ABC transporter substrate-binding protein [Pseudobutyrivibrio sp.]
LLMLLGIALVAFSSTFFYVKINGDSADSQEFTVVTSCSPVYVACLNLCEGVEGVTVTNLSQPTTGCLHEYQLTTADMKALAAADVLVVNGGGMEGYLSDVMATYPKLKIVDSSQGIVDKLIIETDEENHEQEEDVHQEENHDDEAHEENSHDHGGVNSHTWMSPECFMGQCEYIARELGEIAPSKAEAFKVNCESFRQEIEVDLGNVIVKSRKEFAGSKTVILHEACEYVANDLGMVVSGCMDLDEERQVSAGEVAKMAEIMESEGVKIILAEEDYGKDMAEILAKETGARIIYIKTMIRGNYSKDSYIKLMLENYGIS